MPSQTSPSIAAHTGLDYIRRLPSARGGVPRVSNRPQYLNMASGFRARWVISSPRISGFPILAEPGLVGPRWFSSNSFQTNWSKATWTRRLLESGTSDITNSRFVEALGATAGSKTCG